MKGVIVTVFIGDVGYISVTDENGTAVFTQLNGEMFPANAIFKAEREGHGTLGWSFGEAVPRMEKEDSTQMYILIAVVVIMLLVIIFLMFRKKKEEETYSFEE